MDHYTKLILELQKLNSILREIDLYTFREPTEHDLSSTEPFGIDRLAPQEWLQWVFIEKMLEILEKKDSIPYFLISPYMEEALKDEAGFEKLITQLQYIESLLVN
ncbi:MAG: YqcC family protein [Psittacicella sp.]